MNTHTLMGVAIAATLVAIPSLSGQTIDADARVSVDNPANPGAASPPAAVVATAEDSVTDEILVGFKPGSPAAQREGTRAGIGARKLKEFAAINVQHWKLPPGLTVQRAIEILSANPNVQFAEPNYIVRTNQFVPDDELSGDLYGMHNVGQNGGIKDADIDALEAWQLPAPSAGSPVVVVGVIDTGIDYTHPDLAGKIWENLAEKDGDPGVDDDQNGYIDDVSGWDFVNNDNDAKDDNNHGTHVSGTIAGVGANGIGVIGVAGLNPKVMLVPLKFLSASGSGTTDAAIAAVLYSASLKDAAGNQVIRITNNSWGGGSSSQALQDAIRTSGTLFVAAAGNSGSSTLQYPAGYDLPNILSVAATDAKDGLAAFSNFGSAWVDLGAPGVSILSTTRSNSYARFNGTSMATPHVAGAAALLLSQVPTRTSAEIKQQLLDTGDGVASLAGKTTSGKRLNVARALGAPALPTDDIKPPNVLTGVAIVSGSISETALTISWPDAADGDGAYLYDLRYRAGGEVNETNWLGAIPVFGEAKPPTGSTLLVQGLSPGLPYYFAVRTIDAAGNESALSTNVVAETIPVRWKPTIVDTLGEVGTYRSLAVDSSDRPVIAYSDQTNNRVKVATRNATAWNVEAFGTGYGGVSLALTSTGVPSVSWASGKLYFATKTTGSWAITQLEKGNVQGDVTSHAYAPDGTPGISYNLLGSGVGLKFAWRHNSTWKTQLVVAGATARYSSLAFKPSGAPMIAYSQDTNADNQLDTLMLVEATGSAATGYQWGLPQPIDAGVIGYGVFCSLASDAAGNPLIVHRGVSRLRFLRRIANVWLPFSEVDSASTCEMTYRKNGPDESVFIAYTTGGRAKVAKTVLPSDGTGELIWTLSLAEGDTSVTGTPSIDLTAAGVPALAYSILGDLRFTTEETEYEGPSFLYLDDMENNALYPWTTEGDAKDTTSKTRPPGPNDPNDGNLWHRTTRRGTQAGHTPVTSWYYGLESSGNYDTNARNWGRLISRSITIPKGSRAELKVAQLAQAEGGSRYENAEIQISEDDGATWKTVLTRASRTTTSFVTETVDLSAYLEKEIRIGFFFDTKDSNFNEFEGWYVDDVNVKWWP